VRKSWYRKKTALGEAGITVRNKGKQERQIQTTQGVLNLRRSVLKVQRDGTEGRGQRNREILPLDDYLRISGLPFKMSPEMIAETWIFIIWQKTAIVLGSIFFRGIRSSIRSGRKNLLHCYETARERKC
jgi:hypothetical protein